MRQFFLHGIFALLLIVLITINNASAQIPKTMSYQASLLDPQGNPYDGAIVMTFSIFEDEVTGVVPTWTEVQFVVANQGFVNVYLGKTVPLNLPFDKQYWLEIKVNDGTPYPRVRMTSSPYSMNSLNAVKADTANVAKTAITVLDGSITQSKLDPAVKAIPMGPAGGDLTGTYPNPRLREGVLLDMLGDDFFSQFLKRDAIPQGDLSGRFYAPIVAGIRGVTVSPTPPLLWQTFVYDGDVWMPSYLTPPSLLSDIPAQNEVLFFRNGNFEWDIPLPAGPAGGDLAGLYPNPTIANTAGNNIITAINDPAATGVMNILRLAPGTDNQFLVNIGGINTWNLLNVGISLVGNGVGTPLNLNLANPNTWTATQTFSVPLGNGIVVTTNADLQGTIYNSLGDLVFGNNMLPTVTNTYDLGSMFFHWRDIYAASVTNPSGDFTVNDNLIVNGTITTTDGLTGLLTDGEGINTFTYNGSANASVNVNVDGTTIGINAGDALWLMDNSVTNAKIVDATIFDAEISPTAGIQVSKLQAMTPGQFIYGSILNLPTVGNMSGDATIGATGALTLATVNATVGTFGNASTVPQITVNGKGLITNVVNVPLVINPGSITLTSGNILVGNASNFAAGVAMSGDATIINTGALTIANGAVTSIKIFDGTIVPIDADLANAGWIFTNLASRVSNISGGAAGSLLYQSALNTTTTLAIGTNGQVLQVNAGLPAWGLINAGSLALANNFILVGNAGTAQGVAMSGDATIAAGGALTIANDAITTSKILNGTIAPADVNLGVTGWFFGNDSRVTNLAGGAVGSIPYQAAADMTGFLGIGAANTIMTSTGAAPQWVASLTDAQVTNALTINGGTIDNTPIGAVTASTAVFRSNSAMPALQAWNTSTGHALSVPDGGGDVKLAYRSVTVVGDVATIPDDATVVNLIPDPSIGDDDITLPAGENGKILFITFVGDAPLSLNRIQINGHHYLPGADKVGVTLVYSNGAWFTAGAVSQP